MYGKIKVQYIVEIKNKLGNGCTIPFVVWCDDGKKYIVKFPGNEQGLKALVFDLGTILMNFNCQDLKKKFTNYQKLN